MTWLGPTWECVCGYTNAIIRKKCRNNVCNLPRPDTDEVSSALSKFYAPLDPNHGNPFEPPETSAQRSVRVGREIRESVDARLKKEGM